MTLALPLEAKSGVAGAIVFGWFDPTTPLDKETIARCSQVARWVASSLERTRYRDRETVLVSALRGEIETRRDNIGGLAAYGQYHSPWGGAPLGGDWHDVWETPSGSVLAVLGDVAGHGVAVSPTMLTLRSYVRAIAHFGEDLGELLGRIDSILATFDREQGLAALALVNYNPTSAIMSWLNAGLPSLLLRQAEGTVIELEGGRTGLVGTGLDRREAAVGTVTLGVGDTVVLHTDGLLLPDA